MAAPIASVVIPTHDHGATLRPTVASALGQTVAELELLIVGDGMPPEAAAVARELAARDERVRLFEFPKGERHGEANRDRVVREQARGRFVLYLSDDDLWHPQHAERLIAALRDTDFAAAPYARVHRDQTLDTYPHDLAEPRTRALMCAEPRHYNHVVLSAGAHTREAYDRLERGWSPAPPGIWTDLHFWRGFVGDERFKCVSTEAVTAFNFAASERVGVPGAERVAELEAWAAARLATPAGLDALRAEVADGLRRALVRSDLDYQQVYDALGAAERLTAQQRAAIEAADERATAARARLERIESLPVLRWGRTRLGRRLLARRARRG